MTLLSTLLLLAGTVTAHEGHETWALAAQLPVSTSDLTATSFGDSIALAGGCVGDQLACDDYDGCFYCPEITAGFFVFDAVERTFEQLPDMPRARYRHTAVAAGKSLYLFGGRDLEDNLLAPIDVYSFETGAWRTIANVGAAAAAWSPTSDLSAFAAPGGTAAYVYGGYDANYTSVALGAKFDVATETFTAAPPLTTGRGDFALLVVEDTVVAVGGWNDADWCTPLTSVEAVALPMTAASAWAPAAPLAVGRGDKAAASDGNVAWVAGGERKDPTCTLSVPVYDVEILDGADATAWDVVADIPEERFRAAAAIAAGGLYVFGGQATRSTEACAEANCHPVMDHVWVFDVSDHDDPNGGGSSSSSKKKKSSDKDKEGAMLGIGIAVGLIAGAALTAGAMLLCRPKASPRMPPPDDGQRLKAAELVPNTNNNDNGRLMT